MQPNPVLPYESPQPRPRLLSFPARRFLKRALIVLALTVSVPTLIALLALLLFPPPYEVNGFVLVRLSPPTLPITSASLTSAVNDVTKQLRSRNLAQPVYRDLLAARPNSFASIEELERSVTFNPIPESRMIQFRAYHQDPDLVLKVLNAYRSHCESLTTPAGSVNLSISAATLSYTGPHRFLIIALPIALVTFITTILILRRHA